MRSPGRAPTLLYINEPTNEVFFGTASPDAAIRKYQIFVAGLIGATIAGWGVFMLFVARHGFARRERWAWICFAFGIDIWFVIDTAVAILYGTITHVGFNVVMLVLAAIPLAATWREFFGRRANNVPIGSDPAIAT